MLRVIHEVGAQVTIVDGAHLLLTYHYGDVDRYPYCHPVCLPGGGPPITLCRPFDHPWHLGLYFAWKYLNGHNVWEGPDSGEPWGRTVHGALQPVRLADPPRVGVQHRLWWTTAEGRPLLAEERVLLVHPPTGRAFAIDWVSRFTPVEPAVVFERKREWGGYAGLAVRLPRSFLRPQIRNALGQTDPAETHQARAAWTDYSGGLDGLDRPAWGGVAILDHPQNPRFPTPWLTYSRPDLQFLNAAFLRDAPFVLRQGESLVLAYRVLVHWDVADPAGLDQAAQAFVALAPQALLETA